MNHTYYASSSPEEQKTFREWLKGVLRTSNVTVEFVKTDGTTRVMNCTLKSDTVVPPVKKTERQKAESDEVCPVFDLEKSEWRSFRYDTIKLIKFYL